MNELDLFLLNDTMGKLIKQLVENRLFIFSKGTSMLPILYENDHVFLKKITFGNIEVNDIVSFRKGNKTITHRVIYKTNKYLVTKGDNNLESDGKIYPKQIIGKVFQIKRNGKIVNLETLYLLQSTFYFQEIIEMKSLLEKEKINFVFLKGLPLHLYFEKTHPKRVYADCDVLINKNDFQKAEKILLKNNYKKTDTNDKKVENNYFKVINGFSVIFDIHLEPAFLMTRFSGLEALYPQKLIDQLSDEFLKTKKVVQINGESFLILNSKFLILYLALHLFHHNFRGAFRFDFLDKVIKKSRPKEKDWLEMAQVTNKYQLENFVSPVFLLLKKYYLTPIPDFVNFKNFMNFKNLNIFDDELRIRAGINRFKLIFILSPQPLWRKLFIFFNPTVVWSILWVIWKKLSSFFSGRPRVR